MKNYIHYLLLFAVLLLSKEGTAAPVGTIEKTWSSNDSIYVEGLIQESWVQKTMDVDRAVESAKKAIAHAEKVQFTRGRANGLHTLGMVYWYQNDLPSALQFFLEALDIRLDINDKIGVGRSYNNIGNVYFDVAKYDVALEYYQKSLELRQEINDWPGLIYSFCNIGDVYLKKGALQQAFSQYKRSEQIALSEGDKNQLSYVKGRLGDLALKKGFSNRASVYWEEALRLAKDGGDKRQLARCLCKTTELTLITKEEVNINAYRALVFQALLLAKEIKNIKIQGDAILLLAELSSIEGSLEDASKYKEQYQQLMTNLWVKQGAKAVDEARMNFESNKLNDELIEKEEILTLRLNKMSLFLSAISVVFIIVLIVVYKQRLNQQKRLTETIKREMKKVAEKNIALQQSNEVLEKFAFAASHDLKEPLRNIGAFTDLLERRNVNVLTKDSEEYIGFILSATRQMHRVLDDLLDYAKLTHPPTREKEAVNMSELFSNWVGQHQIELDSKKINIEVANLPIIHAYPKLMADLIHQLMKNAVKFNEEDKPLFIKVGYSLVGNQHIFSVKDNGIGIDLAYKDKIFETFQRLDKHNYPGTGMGLALCKRIMRHHKGEIWVESMGRGKGSQFNFSLEVSPNDLPPVDGSALSIVYDVQPFYQ